MVIEEAINPTIILSSILLSGVLFCVIKYCWQRRRLYYYGSKIKGPFSIPEIGNPYDLVRILKGGMYQLLLEVGEKYKPIGKFWVGHYLFVIVSRPEHIEFLLKNCLEKGQPYEYVKVLFGEALIAAPVEKWKRHRKLVNFTFNQTILKSYMDIFIKHSNKLRDGLKGCRENTQIDMFSKLSQCTVGVICESCVGVDPTEFQLLNQNSLLWNSRAEKLIGSRLYNPLFHFDFIWRMSSAGKEILSICNKVRSFTGKIIEKKRHEKLTEEKCFLDHLIKLTDENGKWTTEELVQETITLNFAGSDTTTVTLSFVVLMLAIHLEFQEKVFDELSTIFGDSDRVVALDDLDRMVYLQQFIEETMRLFPVGPAILRSVHEDVVLDFDVIPKGSTLLIPIAYVHKDPDVWPDPLKFDPDRFLLEEVAKRHRYSYMPFSIPPRNCIGFKFALMFMKVALSTILRHFKISSSQYSSVKEIELKFNVLLSATNGYKVALQPR